MNSSFQGIINNPFARIRLWSPMSMVVVLLVAVCVFGSYGPAICQQTSDYRLGSEDLIVVQVMGHQELSGEFLVPTDGVINLQRGGPVKVAGKTLTEASGLVVQSLKSTLLDPDVSVTLKTPRPQLVQMVGAVQKPGPYNVKPGWRLTEGLSAAGGILPSIEAADCTVTILRAVTGAKESVQLTEVMRGSEAANKPIFANDVVTVESVELMPVYVMGQVTRPGLYSLRKGSAGVLEAITVAGGTLESAALSKVTITHLSGDSETIDIVPAVMAGKQQASLKLRSGDLVLVPESTAKIAVLGWVNQPGYFPMRDGQTIHLVDALGMAKGVDNKRGGLGKVAIIRMVDGKQQRLLFDVAKFSKNGDPSQNPEVLAGDMVWVPETGSIDWDKAWSKIGSFLWVLR
jgi:polysaccharide export outer membrane protein